MNGAMSDAERAQRVTALAHAQAARLAKAEVKRKLARCEMRFEDALDEPTCSSSQVVGLLVRVPTVGRRTAQKLLIAAGISHTTKVGDMTDRQRAAITQLVRRRETLDSFGPRPRR